MKLWIAGSLLLLALPGLVRRQNTRTGRILQAVATLFALACLGFGLLEFARSFERTDTQRVWVVPTGDVSLIESALTEQFGRPVRVMSKGSLATRLAQARLGQRSGDPLVVLWNGRLPPTPLPSLADATAWIPMDPWPFDPRRLRIEVVGEQAVGRPAALTMDLHGVPSEVAVVLRLEDPAGREVVRVERASGSKNLRADFVPDVAGNYRASIECSAGKRHTRGSATVSIAGSQPIIVVGDGTATNSVVGMLKAQGFAARKAASLPQALVGQIVLTGSIDAADAKRLRRFVEDGGGAFLVGAANGGALAGMSEGRDLQWLSPLRIVAPPTPLKGRTEAKDGDQPGPQPGKPEGKGESGNEPDRPAKGKPGGRGDGKQDKATGDTTGAKVRNREKIEVDRRYIAMALVIDRSWSMSAPIAEGSGTTRMDLAKRAAWESALDLTEGDELAVLTFGDPGQGHVVLRRTKVRDKARIREALEKLAASRESTFLADGLTRAAKELAGSKAAVKHIVIVTDGAIEDSKGVRVAAIAAARDARRAGCTVTLLQIVPEDGDAIRAAPARDISKAGGGRFVRSRDIRSIPKLVLAEVRRTLGSIGRKPKRQAKPTKAPDGAGKKDEPKKPDAPKKPEPPAKRDEPQKPEPPRLLQVRAVSESKLLLPRPRQGFPALAGVLPARARPADRVLLVAGDDGIPLLAFGNRGLGRVGAWAASVESDWASRWLDDPTFPGRLALWLQSLRPARTNAPALLRPALGKLDAPVPFEVATLRAAFGSLVSRPEQVPAGMPARLTEQQSRLPEFALWGALSLLVLVLLERLAATIRARPGLSVYPSRP